MREHRERIRSAELLAACASVLALATGCVPDLPKSRTSISHDLTGRTGAGLRAQGDRAFGIPPGLRLDDSVSVDEAVAIALWNNATFQADLAQLGTARGDLADAGVLPNPIATLLFPIGAKQLELTVRQPLGAIWQRPRRVAAARKDAARIAETLVQRGLEVMRDVQIAYANVLLAEQLLSSSREAAAIWNEIAELEAARLRSGEVSRREVESARADMRGAQVEIEQATTDVEVATGTLRERLGAPADFVLNLVDSPVPPMPGEAIAWTARALEGRPDLRAAKLAIEAASERAGLERRRIVDLVGLLDINGTGPEIGPGLELSLPIFDQRQGGRIRARAELERASWAYLAVRQQIVREVTESHARFSRTSAALATWMTEILPARIEARRLAAQGFRSGEESHLVVLDATRALIDATRRVAELKAEHRRAAAALAHATGGTPNAN